MKKPITMVTLALLMLALVSIPAMANETAAQKPAISLATITADMAIPIAVSADVAPLVGAIEAQTRSLSIGFLFLITTMLGISVGIYHDRRQAASTTEAHASRQPRKPVVKKPEAGSAQSYVPKKPRKPRIKKQTAATVA